jgi:hypothetical protein
MEYGVSSNDRTPIALGKWLFVVGQAEAWPQHGSGPITVGGTQTTGFKGALAHMAIWNRLLSAAEITSIWMAGTSDLSDTPMYHSYT